MREEHIEDLRIVSSVPLATWFSGYYRELNQCLIGRRPYALNGQHDVVLGGSHIESTPDAPTKKNEQTEDINDLSTKLHCRGDPDNIEEAQ